MWNGKYSPRLTSARTGANRIHRSYNISILKSVYINCTYVVYIIYVQSRTHTYWWAAFHLSNLINVRNFRNCPRSARKTNRLFHLGKRAAIPSHRSLVLYRQPLVALEGYFSGFIPPRRKVFGPLITTSVPGTLYVYIYRHITI